MYDRIIVPVNDAIATRAVSVGGDLARSLGARLELASVVSRGLESRNRAALAELARGLGPDVGTRVVADDGEPIGRQLARLGADRGALLCLGTKARHPAAEVVFGSVGEEAIRRSERPLLAVGPACRRHLAGSTVKIAVDGTEGAESVVESAAALANALGARAQLVLVTKSGSTAFERCYLDDLAHRTVAHDVSAEVVEGADVRRVLVEAFGTHDTVIAAMATHGLGKVERLFGGSVALDVLRTARCPILIAGTGVHADRSPRGRTRP